MGYWIESLSCGWWDFEIEKKNFDAVLDAVRKANEKREEEWRKIGRLYYSAPDYTSIDDLFRDQGYIANFDAEGNIESIDLNHESLADDHWFFSTIAPWVKAGSKLDFVGEDQEIWRWFFTGKEMVDVEGVVVFQDVPIEEES